MVIAMVKVPHGLALSALTYDERANREQNHDDADHREVGYQSPEAANFHRAPFR
jgi:hypothetical protein